MCLAQGHNAMTSVRLEPAASRSRVKHSTSEALLSHNMLICSAGNVAMIQADDRVSRQNCDFTTI